MTDFQSEKNTCKGKEITLEEAISKYGHIEVKFMYSSKVSIMFENINGNIQCIVNIDHKVYELYDFTFFVDEEFLLKDLQCIISLIIRDLKTDEIVVCYGNN